MKITDIDIITIQVNRRETWVFVHVDTDVGLRGLGELNPSAPRAECLAAVRQFAEIFIGQDPRRIAYLTASCGPTLLDRNGIHALSALEQALWDILGKSLNVPIHALLGGRCRDQIHLYANITRATSELTPEAFVRRAQGAVADGFDAVKIAPFSGGPGPIDDFAVAADGIECARAVRRAIGPDIDLLLDCYGLFTIDVALKIAAALDDINLFWLEEPVAADDYAAYLRLKAQTGLRLAGGERFMLRQGFWNLMAHNAVDVIMPDVGIVGGIAELDKVASMAEGRGMVTAPHGPFGPVTVAAGAQVMAAHTGFLILEYAWGLNDWRPALTIPSEVVTNGSLLLSDRPGLGLELNPDTVEQYRVAE
jgi:galactonate dehydratase